MLQKSKGRSPYLYSAAVSASLQDDLITGHQRKWSATSHSGFLDTETSSTACITQSGSANPQTSRAGDIPASSRPAPPRDTKIELFLPDLKLSQHGGPCTSKTPGHQHQTVSPCLERTGQAADRLKIGAFFITSRYSAFWNLHTPGTGTKYEYRATPCHSELATTARGYGPLS